MINRSLLLLIILLAVVFWRWWLPTELASQDLPFVSSSSLKQLFNLPFAWSEYGSEGLGQYTVFTLWSWPLNLLSGLLAHLGFNFTALTKFYLGVFLVIGSFSIWSFTKYLRLTAPAQFIASLLYLTNTYILLVLDGGQLNIAIAYALVPLAFMLLDQALRQSIKDKLKAALIVYLISVCDIRFVYLVAILMLLRVSFSWPGLKQAALTILVIGLSLVGLHFYWLYPLITHPLAPGIYSGLTESSPNAALINLGHSLSLLAPHWYQNSFGVISPLKVEFLLIPMLVFLAFIFRKRDQQLGFWLTSALIFVFFSKGTSEPLGQIYTLAYTHIPGFSLFRDSTKFLLLVVLSYSALIGITVDELLKRFKNISNIRLILPGLITLSLIAMVYPVWLGGMRGTFSKLPFQSEHQQLVQTFEADPPFSRILWLPSLPPLGYFSPTHPAIEASRLYNKRPFASGVLGTYEKYNFLREAPYSKELMDVAGVGYISYPPLDPRQPNLDQDSRNYYQIFLNQLSSLPWLEPTELPTLLKTKAHQDRFFITDQAWLVIGSDDIYKEATLSARAKLSTNALIFAEERPETIKTLIDKPGLKILLNDKSPIDLAAALLPISSLIFPSEQLKTDPDQSGWWKRESKDYLWWRDFLRTKYGLDNQDFDLGGGWAVGEGESQFTMNNVQFTKGEVLLVRVMGGSKGGELKFSQENQLIGVINTKTQHSTFGWFEVGKLTSNEPLTIVSSGGINVINALAVVSEDEWDSYQKQAQDLLGRVQSYSSPQGILTWQNQAQVAYQMINPTKYKVTISGFTSPRMLVFSQTFDPRWRIGTQAAVPVYSFLNGFWIEQNGEYLIEFGPQRELEKGLIISGLSSLLILAALRKFSS